MFGNSKRTERRWNIKETQEFLKQIRQPGHSSELTVNSEFNEIPDSLENSVNDHSFSVNSGSLITDTDDSLNETASVTSADSDHCIQLIHSINK